MGAFNTCCSGGGPSGCHQSLASQGSSGGGGQSSCHRSLASHRSSCGGCTHIKRESHGWATGCRKQPHGMLKRGVLCRCVLQVRCALSYDAERQVQTHRRRVEWDLKLTRCSSCWCSCGCCNCDWCLSCDWLSCGNCMQTARKSMTPLEALLCITMSAYTSSAYLS